MLTNITQSDFAFKDTSLWRLVIHNFFKRLYCTLKVKRRYLVPTKILGSLMSLL